jgi:hypothetical protein
VRFRLSVSVGPLLIAILGCGNVVLLGMFGVFVALFVRTLKGSRSTEEHEYTVDSDAEEIFVAPVQYTYPIEKVEVVEAAESK